MAVGFRSALMLFVATLACSAPPDGTDGGSADAAASDSGTGDGGTPMWCASRSQCPFPQGCIAGVCGLGCTSNGDCGRLVCTSVGECALCQAHDECAVEYACIAGLCDPGCRSGADCSGMACIDGRCERCLVGSDCDTGLCEIGRGVCFDCRTDTDCSAGEECLWGYCTPKPVCTSHSLCRSLYGVGFRCHKGRGECEPGCTVPGCDSAVSACNPCPAGEECEEEYTGKCWPEPCTGCGTIGAPCWWDDYCQSGLCYDQSEEGDCTGGVVCTIACSTDAECQQAAGAQDADYPQLAVCLPTGMCDLISAGMGNPITYCP